MGWQGEIRRRKELERVARHFGVNWQDVKIWCWRDDGYFWVNLPGAPRSWRVRRDTLEPAPLRLDL